MLVEFSDLIIGIEVKNLSGLSGDDDVSSEMENSRTWTTADKTIDTVLNQTRAVNPDAAGCKAALEASLAAIAQ